MTYNLQEYPWYHQDPFVVASMGLPLPDSIFKYTNDSS
jgi:hypothetical protein